MKYNGHCMKSKLKINVFIPLNCIYWSHAVLSIILIVDWKFPSIKKLEKKITWELKKCVKNMSKKYLMNLHTNINPYTVANQSYP